MEARREQELVNKIRSLPPEKIAVVDDFIEFLRHRDDDSFKKVWDNPDDAEYDNL